MEGHQGTIEESVVGDGTPPSSPLLKSPTQPICHVARTVPNASIQFRGSGSWAKSFWKLRCTSGVHNSDLPVTWQRDRWRHVTLKVKPARLQPGYIWGLISQQQYKLQQWDRHNAPQNVFLFYFFIGCRCYFTPNKLVIPLEPLKHFCNFFYNDYGFAATWFSFKVAIC